MRSYVRPLTGLGTVIVIVTVCVLAVVSFQGGFTDPVPVTVIADRAGLVMDPDAKVKMLDVEVGRVASIDDQADGTAAIHLAMDPAKVGRIPENVRVEVASSTVFGAKYVQLVPSAEPSATPLRAGARITADHVTIEVNTLFQQLTSALSAVDPQKLNATLGALSAGLEGRGQRLGETITNLNSLLTDLDPVLPTLSHDIGVAPTVLNTFADVAPDLMRTLGNASRLSNTLVDRQGQLDGLLLSVVGLADVGNDVIGGNRGALTDTLHLLTPLTDLTNQYNPALYCALAGILPLLKVAPLRLPGAEVSTGFTWGADRYRYPGDLPKVAAKGGPQCVGLPDIGFEKRPPYVVADTGSNPYKYGNTGIVLNSDGLKQLLFGPIDGPPRNSSQIGQPG